MILLFTNKSDVHPTPVIEKIIGLGESIFRINTEDLLVDYVFSWWAKDGSCDFIIKCIPNGLECIGSEVTAVWDRRPDVPTSLLIENDDVINKHNRLEALEFLRFIRHYLRDVPSIGSILMDRSASSKMLQYKYAAECGLKFPDTCFSNRKDALVSVISKYKELCIKGISGEAVSYDDKMLEYIFWTKKIQSSELEDVPEEAFSQTVSFVQEYIPKAFELRVTFVGDETFACRIDSQEMSDETGAVDWRQGYLNGLKYSQYVLPEEIRQCCVSFLRKMNINFGCFDFIVTPEEEYVMLECNPNGQWLWVENETGLNISGAIASWLLNPHTL